MKKFCVGFAALITVMMLSILSCYADGQQLFKADFENYIDYVKADGSLDIASYLSDIGIISTFSSGSTEICNNEDEHGAILHISNGSGGTPTVGTNMNYQYNEDFIVVEFDLKAVSKFSAYTFPSIGNVTQTWMGVSSGASTIDTRLLDTNVTGTNKWRAHGQIIKTGEDAPWYHFKYTVDVSEKTYSAEIYEGNKSILNVSGYKTYDNATISKISWDLRSGSCMLDNIEVYTIEKTLIKYSNIEDGGKGVPIEYDLVVKFSQPIEETTINGVQIEEMNEDEYTITLTEPDTVRIHFNENLNYESTYNVDFSMLKGVNGTEASKQIISFTTEDAPLVYIKNLSLGAGNKISADNNIHTFDMTVANEKNNAENVTVFVAVYDKYKYMRGMNFINITMDALSEKHITNSFFIPEAADGGSVRLFIWNDVLGMNPQSLYIQKQIEQNQ